MDIGAWRATVHAGHKDSDMTERLTHCLTLWTITFFLSFWLYHTACKDLSSPTRDQVHTPCFEGTESEPLDCQQVPSNVF